MTEKAFVTKARKRLAAEVGGVWITFPRTRYAKAGVSDLLGCLMGRFVALEFKSPGSAYAATEAQLRFQEEVHATRGIACVIDSEEKLNYFIAAMKHLTPIGGKIPTQSPGDASST